MRHTFLLLPLFLSACSIGGTSSSSSGPTLTGTYTGVLQETGGGAKDFVSLAATVTVTQSDLLELTFSSPDFPSFNAIVLSTGSAAVNLDLVDYSPGVGVQVQEVGFTKSSSGSWLLALQTAAPGDGSSAALVQFASYDPMDAPPATAVAAVAYLDQLLAEISSSK